MKAEAFAPAKINLTLHITGQRADGYHLLDSLVLFADVGDRISVTPGGAGLRLTVTGPMAAGVPTDDSNLVLRAAQAAGLDAAAISLEKHLPAAAGIGGGSSDAAATLRAVAQIKPGNRPDPLALGADVPACLAAQTLRMSGIGEQIVLVPGVPVLDAVLVNPGVSVSTPQVFSALQDKNGTPMPDLPRFADAAALIAWLAGQRNDLQPPARMVQPVIGQVLEVLSDASLARMSGSGATCFGLYADTAAAHDAAKRIARDRPGWWVRPTRLG